eukprot:9793607-Alexandrium_andersonii.AAC.1
MVCGFRPEPPDSLPAALACLSARVTKEAQAEASEARGRWKDSFKPAHRDYWQVTGRVMRPREAPQFTAEEMRADWQQIWAPE